MAATVTISSGATWQEVAADRRKHRDSTLSLLDPTLPTIDNLPLNTIPLASKYLTAEEIKITETLPEILVSQLAKGALSSVAVTKAFLRRAGLAQLAVRLRPSFPFPPLPSPSLPFPSLFCYRNKMTFHRQTASPSSSPSAPSPAPSPSTPTSRLTKPPSAPSTASPSASKNTSACRV
jgi:hypothetical protein